MKKIYTTIVVMMIASIAFAQITPREVNVFDTKAPLKAFQKKNNNSMSKGESTFWFSYGDALKWSNAGTSPEWSAAPMLQDSIALVHYSNGDFPIGVYSYAQVFDFNDPWWEEAYMTSDNVPLALYDATEYTIDSVFVTFLYQRGTNVPANIVDTFVLTIAAGTFQYKTHNYQGSNLFKYAELPYDKQAVTIPNTGFAKYETYRFPLTVDDETMLEDGKYYYLPHVFPIANFANINQKQVVVAYSYISGVQNRTLTSVYGEAINDFSALYYEDYRSNTTEKDFFDLFETNTSLCALNLSVRTSNIFSEKYATNMMWIGQLQRPDIGVRVKCNDCTVGIPETETKSISIKPNPATNNFTLTLADAGTAQVELFNLVGQKVYGTTTAEQALNVNVSNLNNGIYMLKVTQNGKVHTSKIVVR